MTEQNNPIQYRFSGHETFPCRYAWLPKAYRALADDTEAFCDEDKAMVTLGVGKNMVRAIRFWVQVADIAVPAGSGQYETTSFGRALLGPRGRDPYLEDIRTLWLLHWKLSTRAEDPLFAWDYLLNRWQTPEISPSAVLQAFKREAERLERKLSTVTLQQHFDTFLHTYVPTRSKKGAVQEDNLDCPLVELELIHRIGDRRDAKGRVEPVYTFRREPKPEITPQLFIYCLDNFWRTRRGAEGTLTFSDVSVAHGSPGQIFKLPEWDLRARLDALSTDSNGLFIYKETAALQQVIRRDDDEVDLLSPIYELESVNA